MIMKIAFLTLGCRLNQAETAILRQQCSHSGWSVVEPNEPADVVVINTCTVTSHGDTDTHRLVHRVRRQNSQARIALIGCQSQVQSQRLAQLPGVRWVIGTGAKMELAQILQQETSDAPVVILPEIESSSFTIADAGIDPQHTRANLKIQDGCDYFCSYCEIPFARGRARSRQFEDLLAEANTLVAAGHHELVLTGINLGLYRDRGRTLLDVIRGLQELPDLWRLRISSVEATTVSSELFRFMTHGKLCRFLHLPLQSGSDAILRAMRRKYTVAEYDAYLHAALQQVPDLCLGADVLVGFPGESDDHFDETLAYLERSPHCYFHVFSYSDRIHNESRNFTHKVTPAVIEKRSRRLRTLSAAKRRAFLERRIGRTEAVLFEEKKNGYWTGVTDTYIRVAVRSDQPLHNQMRAVTLMGVEGQGMTGRLS